MRIFVSTMWLNSQVRVFLLRQLRAGKGKEGSREQERRKQPLPWGRKTNGTHRGGRREGDASLSQPFEDSNANKGFPSSGPRAHRPQPQRIAGLCGLSHSILIFFFTTAFVALSPPSFFFFSFYLPFTIQDYLPFASLSRAMAGRSMRPFPAILLKC